MLRYKVIVFVAMAVLTTTQGFSWGRVFKNEDNKNMSSEAEGGKPTYRVGKEPHSSMTHAETEIVERRLPEKVDDERHHSFRAARTEELHEEEKRVPGLTGLTGLGEEKVVHTEESISKRGVEAVSVSSMIPNTEQKNDGDGELHSVQKEVSEIHRELGPESGPEKVEVIGVARERGHHITDRLADAIAGLMGVYNSLVRSEGRDWDSRIHSPSDGGMRGEDWVNGRMENKTEESVRVSDVKDEKKGGWAPLGVLGGIVLVAGVGVLLVGYSQREREGGPMYPPRGPAYV